ncbi:MAG: hypothetical protein WDA72_07825 [Desulfomonilia bacterium]|nr:hypothetical protein [Desulfomonilia bacterium]HPW69149.1 hypothetical protein [Deltaproteobacteria bacterium]
MDGFTFVVAADVRELAGDIIIDGSFLGLRVISRLNPQGLSNSCSG